MIARTYFFISCKLLERSGGCYDISTVLAKADELFSQDQKKKALEIYEPLIEEIHTVELLNRIAAMQIEEQKLDEAG